MHMLGLLSAETKLRASHHAKVFRKGGRDTACFNSIQLDSTRLDSMNEPLRNSIWNFILHVIDKELVPATASIGRGVLKSPVHLIPGHSYYDARSWLWNKYQQVFWHQIYEFLEFVVENCEDLSGRYSGKKEVYVEFNKILAEGVSGYRFIQGLFTPITDKNEIAAIEQAAAQSNAGGLQGVRTHLEAALQLLGKKPQPDYRNSIKESISAVEAAVKKISGEHGGGLDAALRELAKHVEIHKSLQPGFLSLYGYMSGKSGIRHAILEETNIGFDEAKFILAACSAFVNFLIVKAGTGGHLLGQSEAGEGVSHCSLDRKQKGHRFRWPFCLFSRRSAARTVLSSAHSPNSVRIKDAQNGIPARPQGVRRLRTMLGDIFSIPAMCPFPRRPDISPDPSSAYRSSYPCRRV